MKEYKEILHEPAPDYEKAELDLLKDALARTYTARFHVMTSLMKMSIMIKNAEVKHKRWETKRIKKLGGHE